MNLKLLTVGKLKEAYLREAVKEYEKRLTRFARITVVEVPDEPSAENAGEKERLRVLEKEGERLLAKITEKAYVIALAVNGTAFSSEEMAGRIGALLFGGESDLFFVIGGSLGLSERVLARANEQWSFSRLTFPHQLMRVIALEQIYRSFKILKNEPYHK